jgi:hypothetical protein
MIRVRSLDAIPFSSRLKVDMEIWHWKATTMTYAVTTYWYAMPGATCNRASNREGVGRSISSNFGLLPAETVP